MPIQFRKRAMPLIRVYECPSCSREMSLTVWTMTNTQRIGAACFYAAAAVSQSFIAVVAGSGPGFRSLVLSAAGKSVQAVRSYNPE